MSLQFGCNKQQLNKNEQNNYKHIIQTVRLQLTANQNSSPPNQIIESQTQPYTNTYIMNQAYIHNSNQKQTQNKSLNNSRIEKHKLEIQKRIVELEEKLRAPASTGFVRDRERDWDRDRDREKDKEWDRDRGRGSQDKDREDNTYTLGYSRKNNNPSQKPQQKSLIQRINQRLNPERPRQPNPKQYALNIDPTSKQTHTTSGRQSNPKYQYISSNNQDGQCKRSLIRKEQYVEPYEVTLLREREQEYMKKYSFGNKDQQFKGQNYKQQRPRIPAKPIQGQPQQKYQQQLKSTNKPLKFHPNLQIQLSPQNQHNHKAKNRYQLMQQKQQQLQNQYRQKHKQRLQFWELSSGKKVDEREGRSASKAKSKGQQQNVNLSSGTNPSGIPNYANKHDISVYNKTISIASSKPKQTNNNSFSHPPSSREPNPRNLTNPNILNPNSSTTNNISNNDNNKQLYNIMTQILNNQKKLEKQILMLRTQWNKDGGNSRVGNGSKATQIQNQFNHNHKLINDQLNNIHMRDLANSAQNNSYTNNRNSKDTASNKSKLTNTNENKQNQAKNPAPTKQKQLYQLNRTKPLGTHHQPQPNLGNAQVSFQDKDDFAHIERNRDRNMERQKRMEDDIGYLVNKQKQGIKERQRIGDTQDPKGTQPSNKQAASKEAQIKDSRQKTNNSNGNYVLKKPDNKSKRNGRRNNHYQMQTFAPYNEQKQQQKRKKQIIQVSCQPQSQSQQSQSNKISTIAPKSDLQPHSQPQPRALPQKPRLQRFHISNTDRQQFWKKVSHRLRYLQNEAYRERNQRESGHHNQKYENQYIVNTTQLQRKIKEEVVGRVYSYVNNCVYK